MVEVVCWVPPGLTLSHGEHAWMVPPRSGGSLVEVVPPINIQLALVPPAPYPLQPMTMSALDLGQSLYRTRPLATPRFWPLTCLV
jgi:hypothetical protein